MLTAQKKFNQINQPLSICNDYVAYNYHDIKIKQTLDKIAHLYGQLVERYGFDPRSAGVENEKLHKMRFDLLAQVIDLEIANKGISINDLGCGYGAMFAYLERLKGMKINQYYGYDISEEMLNHARKFIKNSKAELIKSSKIIKKADYSFISGIFNVKFHPSDEEWTQYIKQTLINVAEHSEKGFAFYLLKPKHQLGYQGCYHDDDTINPPLTENDRYFADPNYFKDFCQFELPSFVSSWEDAVIKIEQDYGVFEWTMTIHKT